MTFSWLARGHRPIFFAGLYLAYLVTALNQMPHAPHLGHMAVHWLAPATELALAWIVCSRLDASSVTRRRWTEPAYLGVALLVGLVYAAQTYSLRLSGNFITVLALENRAESWIIRRSMLATALLPALAWWLLFAVGRCCEHRLLQRRAIDATHPRRRALQLALTPLLVVLLAWLFHAQRNHELLQADYRQSPMTTMARAVYDATRDGAFDHLLPWPFAQAIAMPAQAHYPLEKFMVYSRKLPFPSTGANDAPPNVIVLFLEGTSTRLIGAYGGNYPGLTPAMDRLATRSMQVRNYYNHTAATYRGLQGQLVSGYPAVGGNDEGELWTSEQGRQELTAIRYRSLPLILRENGYRTYFMSPHYDKVGLNTMLRSLGFDKVYSFEDVSRQIAPGNPFYSVEGALSDHDQFHALQVLLKDHMMGHGKQPFFVGLYNFGTHAFLDIMPIGVKYRDGYNASLNKLHNLDNALGQFLDYFFASPYASNTILILTADHATYPEPSYRAVVGQDYQPLFVDTIPLLIYDPVHRLPPSFDAHQRTSIDFAPTLLHLLGIQYARNSFAGTSLFEPDPHAVRVAAIGNEFYAIDQTGVHPEASIPATSRTEFDAQKRSIQRYYKLEQANQLVQPLTQNGKSGAMLH